MPCLRPCSLGAGRQAVGVDKTVITDVDKRTQVLGGAGASSGKEERGLAWGQKHSGWMCRSVPREACPGGREKDFTLGQSFVGLHVCS